jgi:two-component system, chemotaxis family, chemotaxis protein CheY
VVNKILIVDDFDIIRANLKKIANQLGIKNIQEAADGVIAWEKLNKVENLNEPFDLIFLDWNMPRMNGLELLLEIKKSEALKNIPIIMTTAEREQKSVITALSSGASDYIVKPFKSYIIH